jgi:hypothetical protein
MALGTVRWEDGPFERQPKALKTKLAQGGPLGLSHSDQPVLVMARREAGPYERPPKTLKGELEKNSRKPRNLTENRHSDSLEKGQLPLSQGKMKK